MFCKAAAKVASYVGKKGAGRLHWVKGGRVAEVEVLLADLNFCYIALIVGHVFGIKNPFPCYKLQFDANFLKNG